MSGILVYVRSIDGERTPIDVRCDATIADLLALYEEQAGTRGGRLSFQGDALPPHQSLADSGVCPESVVEYTPLVGWKPRDDAALKRAVRLLCKSGWSTTGEIRRYKQERARTEKFLLDNHGGPTRPSTLDISSWDTSDVTDMQGLFTFKDPTTFNCDIGGWNTAQVTNMKCMFYDAIAFNVDVSSWNTGRVTNMRSMFGNAKAFNGDVSMWNTASVTNMECMFINAYAFNGDVSMWNTASVTNMESMLMRTMVKASNHKGVDWLQKPELYE